MITIGRRVYGFGAILLGLVALRSGTFSPDWLAVPAGMPGLHILAAVCGGVLLLAGLAVQVLRMAATGGLALTILFSAGLLILQLPQALAKPMIWGVWQGVAESSAMALGGVLVAARPRNTVLVRVARLGFGVCLLVFGISHFVYARLTASLVPAWLPPSQLFWAYATGAAQIATGLALLSGIRARLAAILLTVMYLVFGVAVHLPSVIASPSSADNWTENAINLLLIGVAWCVAEAKPLPRGH